MSNKISELVKNIFENTNKLKTLEPDFSWRNLLGDYGEYIAIKTFNLIKAPSNSKDFDATDKDGRTIQIKSFNTGTNIKFKDSSVDLLLAIKIKDDATFEIIYFDDFDKVKPHSKFSNYSNRYVISISKLLKISNLE
tara:strand:- start:106 stop:516 length:411 start_codon:yes stop_codon:yes gene_type:complete